MSIVFLIAVLLILMNAADTAVAFAGSMTVLVLYVALIFSWSQDRYERDSFENPNCLSNNDAGMIFHICEIRSGRVALLPFGYTEAGIGDKRHTKTYYWASQIPKQLRYNNSVFQISKFEEELVFYKIQVNGYRDKSKPPFEKIGSALRI